MKKLFALILVVCMFVSMAPVTAFAAGEYTYDDNGNGTHTQYYNGNINRVEDCVYTGEYFQVNDQHYQKCVCGAQGPATDCTGGTATCVAKAICTVCEQPYGDVDKENGHVNNFNWRPTKSSGKHVVDCDRCHAGIPGTDHTPEWKWVAQEDGTSIQVCEVCELTGETCKDHNLVIVPAKAPECKENGDLVPGHTAGEQCSVCGFFSIPTEDLTIEHDFETIVVVLGDCTTEGFAYDKCKVCGYETEYVNTGKVHVWDEGKITLEPTCTDKGIKTFKCTLCEVGTKKENVDKLGHDEIEVKEYQWGNCAGNVLTYMWCQRCETATSEVTSAPSGLEHDYQYVRSSVKETCTSIVGDLYACQNEGCLYTYWVDANGNKDYAHCPNTVKHTVPAVDSEDYNVVKEPTCTDIGFAYIYCAEDDCDATIDLQGKDANGMVELAALGHDNDELVEAGKDGDYTGWKVEDATCIADGYFWTKCSVCEENYVKVTNEEDLASEENHSFTKEGKIIVEPICQFGKEANGKAEAVCEFCGLVSDSLLLDVEPEHAYIYNYTITPDCANWGYAWVTCENCDLEFYGPVAPVGKHKFEEVVTAPDCTTPAYKGEFCTVCGVAKDWTKVTEVAPALNHKWDAGVIIENCEVNLCVEYTCTVCGAKQYDGQASGKAHTEVKNVLVEGTCLAPEQYNMICDVCGIITDATIQYDHTSVQEAKHDYAEEVTVDMTCQADGITTKTCKVCGDVATTGTVEKNAAVFHADKANLKYEVLAGEPTCTEEGIVRWYCELCNYEVTEESELGHIFDIDAGSKYEVVVAPTCGVAGKAKVFCAICGAENINEEGKSVLADIDATGEHKFGIVTKYNDKSLGCKGGAKLYWECVVCGAKEVDENGVELKHFIGNANAQAHTWGEETKKTYCGEGTFSFKTCTVCGVESKAKVANATGAHLFNLVEVVKPTCEEDGHVTEVCVICGKVVTTTPDELKSVGHVLECVEEVPSTCTTKGYCVDACKNCDYTIKNAIDAYDKDNHEYVTLRVFAEADCATKTNGIVLEECKYCTGSARYTVVLYSEAHVAVDGEVIEEPTCTEAGSIEQKCEKCGVALEAKEIAKLGHDMAIEVTDATCFVPASWTEKCQREGCDAQGKVYYTSAKLEHVWTEWADEAADCFHAARTARYCELCETVEAYEYEVGHKKYEAQKQHKYELDENDEIIWTVVEEATCVADGLKVAACTLCNTEIKAIINRTPNDHALEIVEEIKAPTCTTTGLASVKCTLCDYKNAKHVVKANGHDWSDVVVAANNMAIYKFCYACGKIDLLAIASTFDGFDGCMQYTKDNVADKAENDFSWSGAHKLVFEADVEPECGVPGIYGKVWCENCGQIMVDEVIRPALEHVEEIIPAVEATCTTAGSTEGKKCTVCGEVFVAPEVIPAGHDLVITEGKDATCTEAGYTAAEKCNKCDYVKEAVEIAALGHVEVVIPGYAATEYAPGMTDGVKCDVCGEILIAQEEIAAKTATLVVPAVLRDAGADDATRVKVFYEGTDVAIKGAMNANGYYEVEVGGMSGWMHHNYLEIGA